MENFIYNWQIDNSVCDELIQYYKDNNEYKFEGEIGGSYGAENIVDKSRKESIDVNFYNPSKHPAIKKYFRELQVGYQAYTKKYDIENVMMQTNPENHIQYYPPGGGFKVWHYERGQANINRALVYMTYLNDVPDGGGTEWLYQNYKTEARKGLSVIWPAEFTHVHRGIVSQHEKYIATGWFNIFPTA